MEFPAMLYLFPGTSRDAAQLQDGKYETAIANNEAELEALGAEGWALTPADARLAENDRKAVIAVAAKAKAHDEAVAAARALIAKVDGMPTRAELEQKATELGLKFDGRTPNKKLAAEIAAKVVA